MSKECRCSGMAVQGGLSQSMSGCSAWQSSCTWLFRPAADLPSCVHWLTSRLGSSLDINNCRFSVGFSVHCTRYDFFLSPDSVVPFQYLRGATSLSEPLSPPVLHSRNGPSCSVPASLKHHWITQNNCSCLYLEVCFGLAERFVNSVSCPLFSIYFNRCNHRSDQGQEPSFSGLWCSAKGFDSPQSSKELLE